MDCDFSQAQDYEFVNLEGVCQAEIEIIREIIFKGEVQNLFCFKVDQDLMKLGTPSCKSGKETTRSNADSSENIIAAENPEEISLSSSMSQNHGRTYYSNHPQMMAAVHAGGGSHGPAMHPQVPAMYMQSLMVSQSAGAYPMQMGYQTLAYSHPGHMHHSNQPGPYGDPISAADSMHVTHPQNHSHHKGEQSHNQSHHQNHSGGYKGRNQNGKFNNRPYQYANWASNFYPSHHMAQHAAGHPIYMPAGPSGPMYSQFSSQSLYPLSPGTDMDPATGIVPHIPSMGGDMQTFVPANAMYPYAPPFPNRNNYSVSSRDGISAQGHESSSNENSSPQWKSSSSSITDKGKPTKETEVGHLVERDTSESVDKKMHRNVSGKQELNQYAKMNGISGKEDSIHTSVGGMEKASQKRNNNESMRKSCTIEATKSTESMKEAENNFTGTQSEKKGGFKVEKEVPKLKPFCPTEKKCENSDKTETTQIFNRAVSHSASNGELGESSCTNGVSNGDKVNKDIFKDTKFQNSIVNEASDLSDDPSYNVSAEKTHMKENDEKNNISDVTKIAEPESIAQEEMDMTDKLKLISVSSPTTTESESNGEFPTLKPSVCAPDNTNADPHSIPTQNISPVPSVTSPPSVMKRSWASIASANRGSDPGALNSNSSGNFNGENVSSSYQVHSLEKENSVVPNSSDSRLDGYEYENIDAANALNNENDSVAIQLGEFLEKYKLDHHSLALAPRGLCNQRNFCYINATLQALLSCPPFVNMFRALKEVIGKTPCYATPIIQNIFDFVGEFEPMLRGNNKQKDRYNHRDTFSTGANMDPIGIRKILGLFGGSTFKVEGRQEDAEEFLSHLLNGLHDEMLKVMKWAANKNGKNGGTEGNGDIDDTTGGLEEDSDDWVVMGKKKRSCLMHKTPVSRSPISETFLGQMCSALSRTNTSKSSSIQPFYTLQLDIQNDNIKSVRDALDAISTKEEVSGFTNSNGMDVNAWRQLSLEELPVVLILHLKRFVYEKSGNRIHKLDKRLDFSIDLDISKELLSSNSRTRYNMNQRKYKLFAVVYHDGEEAHKGHYLADCFHPSGGSLWGTCGWLRFDDTSVKQIPESQLLSPEPPRVPYLLYYRRSDTLLSHHTTPSFSSSKKPNSN